MAYVPGSNEEGDDVQNVLNAYFAVAPEGPCVCARPQKESKAIVSYLLK